MTISNKSTVALLKTVYYLAATFAFAYAASTVNHMLVFVGGGALTAGSFLLFLHWFNEV